MALVMGAALPKTRKKDFGVAKEGMQMARLVRVIDLGLQAREPFNGEEKAPAYIIRLTFELPNDTIEIDDEKRPRWIDREIPLFSSEKSICYQWYHTLDPKNQYKGDWSKLLGAPCMVQIKHRKVGDKTYANLTNVVPMIEGMEVPALDNPTTMFDLTSPDIEVFNGLPEWLQEKIKQNLEYENSKLDRLLNNLPQPATASTGNVLDEPAELDVKAPQAEIVPDLEDFDDDVPF